MASYSLYQSAAGIYLLSFVIALVAFFRRNAGLSRVSSGMLFAGLSLHTLTLLGLYQEHGLTRFLETPLNITSVYVFFTLVMGYVAVLRYGFRGSLCVLFAVPITISLASLTLDPSFSPFAAKVVGVWIQVHLITLMLAYGAFTVASGLGLMLVIRVRTLEQKSRGLLAEILPPMLQLDRATMAALHTGFFLLSFSMLAASYRAISVGWASSGKPGKAFLAVLVWAYYAAVIVGRRWGRWRGARVGWLGFLGILLAFGTFVGMQLLAGGYG
jgi:ABC-type uncharacterized transport system permease subunit